MKKMYVQLLRWCYDVMQSHWVIRLHYAFAAYDLLMFLNHSNNSFLNWLNHNMNHLIYISNPQPQFKDKFYSWNNLFIWTNFVLLIFHNLLKTIKMITWCLWLADLVKKLCTFLFHFMSVINYNLRKVKQS